jgi:GH25 family lysozyme M1 (1,4-beta-N-acetylmuramidase)
MAFLIDWGIKRGMQFTKNTVFFSTALVGLAATALLASVPANAAPASAQESAKASDTNASADTSGSVGIDVSSAQPGFDFSQAHAQGADFAIAKVGGLNVAPQYVSSTYAQQVDAARDAGMHVGHYYVPGQGESPEQQADFFVDNLHNFDSKHDVLVLDDEALDDNGVFMQDHDAAQFMRHVIDRTGISPDRVWFYVGKNMAMTNGPWSEVNDLGVRVWCAAYGTNDGSEHDWPDMPGVLSNVDIHQFTSKATFAGRNVDEDATNVPAKTLFNSYFERLFTSGVK